MGMGEGTEQVDQKSGTQPDIPDFPVRIISQDVVGQSHPIPQEFWRSCPWQEVGG